MNYPHNKTKPPPSSSDFHAQKTEPLLEKLDDKQPNQNNRHKSHDPLRSTVPNGGKPAIAHSDAPTQQPVSAPGELITAKYLTASLDDVEPVDDTRQTLQRLPARASRDAANTTAPASKPAPAADSVDQTTQEDELKIRHSERFEFLPDAGVRVRVAWKAGEEDREIYGDLVDISGTGLRFVSDDCVPVDCELNIAMMAPAPELYLTATACWSRPEAAGHWCTGCRLEVEFPVDVFSEMGARGQINRRRERRKPVSIPAVVSFELDTAKELNAEIIDISTGGMCIAMPGNYVLGTRILVRVQTGKPVQSVPLIVRWNSPSGDTPVVGGSFLNRAGYEAFSAALPDEVLPEPPVVEPQKRPQRRVLQKMAAGIFVAACLIAIVVMFRDIGVRKIVTQANAIQKFAPPNTTPPNTTPPKNAPATTATRSITKTKVASISPVPKPAGTDAAIPFADVDAALKDYAARNNAPVEFRLAPDVADLLLFAPNAIDDAASLEAVTQTPPAPDTSQVSEVVMQLPFTPVQPDTMQDKPGSVSAASEAPLQEVITVHNPSANRGAVAFIWAGNTVSLPAGATVVLPIDGQAKMIWDRGGAFGQISRQLDPGSYEFAVSHETGWQINQAP